MHYPDIVLVLYRFVSIRGSAILLVLRGTDEDHQEETDGEAETEEKGAGSAAFAVRSEPHVYTRYAQENEAEGRQCDEQPPDVQQRVIVLEAADVMDPVEHPHDSGHVRTQLYAAAGPGVDNVVDSSGADYPEGETVVRFFNISERTAHALGLPEVVGEYPGICRRCSIDL